MSRLYSVSLVVVYVFIGACNSVWREYSSDNEYADRTCLSNWVGFQQFAHSALSCLYLCLWHNDCSAVVFQSSDKSCNGLRTDHNVTKCTTMLAEAEYYHANRFIHQWVERVTNFSSSAPGVDAYQAIGPPDCSLGSKCNNSWGANNMTDSEFIEVMFAKEVYITGVDVYETFETGLTTRISAIDSNDVEHVLFENEHVSNLQFNIRVFSPEIQVTDFKSSVLRVYVDTRSYYTDIDAVQLHGRQW